MTSRKEAPERKKPKKLSESDAVLVAVLLYLQKCGLFRKGAEGDA